MSDQDSSVRLMATHCFAMLIQLMPLDGGIPNPPALTNELLNQKARDKEFLEQLFNPKTIPDYKVPVPIRATLRSYQQVIFTYSMLTYYVSCVCVCVCVLSLIHI